MALLNVSALPVPLCPHCLIIFFPNLQRVSSSARPSKTPSLIQPLACLIFLCILRDPTFTFLYHLPYGIKTLCVCRGRGGGVGEYVCPTLCCIELFVTSWTVAQQAPLSMGFPKQEYWSGLPLPSPGDLPHPGSNPRLLCLLHWQAGSLPQAPPGKPYPQHLALSINIC